MQTIKIDFDNPGLPQRLDVVENDAQSRFFKAVLYKDGKAYAAPSGATYSIMYRGFGPQNEGWYDTINDGAGKRAACSVSGNVVTCEIARQALRVPGHVSVMLCVTGSNGYMLHGWPIDCNCRNDNYTGGTLVESFFYITQITNADWTSAIKTWEELKNMIDPTLSLSGKAADARATGNAIKTEKSRATSAESALDNKKADKADLDVERKRIDVLNDGGLNLKDEVIDTSIKDWLDDHPEATTTVQDHSLTINKMVVGTLGYVTPQMFGAKGDAYRYSGGYWRNKNGDIATDDTDAFLGALTVAKNNRVRLHIPAGKYRLTKQLVIDFNGASLIGESEYNTVLCPESAFNGTSVIIINPNYTSSALQNACIKNLTFDFEAISLRGIEFGYLIYGCEFKNLYFQKCTKSGLCALNGKDASEQIIFDNIQLHTFGNKLVEPLVSFSRLHESILRTCRFFGTKEQEVTQEYPLVYMDMPQGVSFISCDFFYQTGSSCIKAESTTQSTVQGVFIYGCSFENNQGSYIVEIEGKSAIDKYASSCNFGSNRINGGNYTLRLKNISASSVTDSWAKLVLEGSIYHSYLIGRVDRVNSTSFTDSVVIELSDNAAKIINSIMFQSDARKITLSKDGLSIVQNDIFTRFVTYDGLASIENNGGRTLFNENGIYLHRLPQLPSTASAYANQPIIVNDGKKDILYVSMQTAKDIWTWIPLNS